MIATSLNLARSVIVRAARKLKNAVSARSPYAPPDIRFSNSGNYWDKRYEVGGNSGAGSYGRLAQFKASFLNAFVAKHGVDSIIEYGSGDGAQLKLANYPNYVGVDVSLTAIERCRAEFAGSDSYAFLHTSEYKDDMTAALTLSLDVIYHLVEDQVFADYMNRLFDSSRTFVIVYSSDKEEIAAPHVRHRKFTQWVAKERPDFRLIHHLPNAYPLDPSNPDETSFADFYAYERVGFEGR